MSYIKEYLDKGRDILEFVRAQEATIQKVAEIFAKSILKDRMIHAFGSGHSRVMVEEMWPGYGSFPGFNPIVELSMCFYNLVVGPNGIRQSMFIENVSGLADRILENYNLSPDDTAFIISSSGCNVVPIEMARGFQKRNIKVVALVSLKHLEGSTSRKQGGEKLTDFADIVLDTGAPLGEGMIRIKGLDTPVAPGSTIGGVLIVNSIKAEIANILVQHNKIPKVLNSGHMIGEQRAKDLFESAYDEHARLMSRLYQNISH